MGSSAPEGLTHTSNNFCRRQLIAMLVMTETQSEGQRSDTIGRRTIRSRSDLPRRTPKREAATARDDSRGSGYEARCPISVARAPGSTAANIADLSWDSCA